MKLIILPFTAAAWYLITYYGIFYGLYAFKSMFSFSWIWIIPGLLISVLLVFGIIKGLPAFLRYYILKLFNFSWYSIIIHSFIGLFAIYKLIKFYTLNPFSIRVKGAGVFTFLEMWELEPNKTIFISLAFTFILISIVWSSVFSSFYLKIKNPRVGT